MIDRDLARAQLTGNSANYFDDIVKSRVLGASRQTKLICKMFESIAEDEKNDIHQVKDKITIVANYFKETRGQNSRAIYNAINEVLGEIYSCFKNSEFNRKELIEKIENYENVLNGNVEKSAEYAAILCQNVDTIMIFDYSSTVDKFIKKLEGKKCIYIPESRALNGGKPFLETAQKAGHEIHFIPDTLMLVALKKCQIAFIGAETIYPDGSVFNTVGADILGILCQEINIPLYAISPLIKTDIRNIYGITKEAPMPFDFSVRLATEWTDQEKEGIDFKGIKLVKIDKKYITGIVTEQGIVPSYAFYQVALDYNKRLEG